MSLDVFFCYVRNAYSDYIVIRIKKRYTRNMRIALWSIGAFGCVSRTARLDAMEGDNGR